MHFTSLSLNPKPQKDKTFFPKVVIVNKLKLKVLKFLADKEKKIFSFLRIDL